MGSHDPGFNSTLINSIDNVVKKIKENAGLGDEGADLLKILTNLRGIIKDLTDGRDINSELPGRITDTTTSVLETCDRVVDNLSILISNNPALLSVKGSRPPSSDNEPPISSSISQLEDVARRLTIVLDIHKLSTSGLLEPDSEEGSSSAAKSDILVNIAQMKGLFKSKVKSTVSDQPRSDYPPPYESATHNRQGITPSGAEQALQTSYVNKKAGLYQAAAASNPPMAAYYGSKEWTRPLYPPSYRPGLDVKTLCTIKPDMTNATKIDKLRCFGHGPNTKLALTTQNSIQVYDATHGTLLWQKDSQSPDMGGESTFTSGLSSSPDDTILCATVKQDHDRKIFVLDATTGSVRSSSLLAQNDSDACSISPDNNKAALIQWGGSAHAVNFLKIIRLHPQQQDKTPPRQILFKQLSRWRGVGAAYAPDNRHVVVLEGPVGVEYDTSDLSVSIRIYDDETGALNGSFDWPGPASPGFLQNIPPFRADFLYPCVDGWLICFPDYHDSEKTRVVDARTGQTVMSVTADRNFSQFWNAGFLPSMLVSMACDEVSGIFTRTEINETVIPRGKTATVTRFTLEGARNREQAVREMKGERWSRVKVVKMGVKDKSYLSATGLQLVIHRDGTNQLDIVGLAL